jgi:hypothetical protein
VLAFTVDVARGLLRGGDRVIGVAPDQIALLRGRGVGPLVGERLCGVHPLHVPNDAHASSSLGVCPIATISIPNRIKSLGASLRVRCVHEQGFGRVAIAHGSAIGTGSDCPSWKSAPFRGGTTQRSGQPIRQFPTLIGREGAARGFVGEVGKTLGRPSPVISTP